MVVDDGEIIRCTFIPTIRACAGEGLKYGAITSIKIENMREQHTEKLELTVKDAARIAAPEKKYGFVAVAAGDGVLQVFYDLGVDNTVEGGQTMNPSTEDILNSINRTPAEIVFVLPNNKNIILSADRRFAYREKGNSHTHTHCAEGISALLAFDPEQSEDVNAARWRVCLKCAHRAYHLRRARFGV